MLPNLDSIKSNINEHTPIAVLNKIWMSIQGHKEYEDAFVEAAVDSMFMTYHHFQTEQLSPLWMMKFQSEHPWKNKVLTVYFEEWDKKTSSWGNNRQTVLEHFKKPELPTAPLALFLYEQKQNHGNYGYGMTSKIAQILETKHYALLHSTFGTYSPMQALHHDIANLQNIPFESRMKYENYTPEGWARLFKELSPSMMDSLYYEIVYNEGYDQEFEPLIAKFLSGMKDLPLQVWRQCLGGNEPQYQTMFHIEGVKDLSESAYKTVLFQIRNPYANVGLAPIMEVAFFYYITSRPHLISELASKYYDVILTPLASTLYKVNAMHHKREQHKALIGSDVDQALPKSGPITQLPLLTWPDMPLAELGLTTEQCAEYGQSEEHLHI